MEESTATVFFALALLLVSTHCFAFVFERFGLPRVIGEITSGLLLGPTVLGFFLPSLTDRLFNTPSISHLYWFGLVLLMFVSGFSVQASFDRNDRKIIVAVILGSTLLPFAAGWLAASFLDVSLLTGPVKNSLAFQIIFAIAVAVTSIPVISKIFLDLNLMTSRFAKIVLCAAMIHDVILYVALSVSTSLVRATDESPWLLLKTVAITAAFIGTSLLVGPRILRKVNSLQVNFFGKSATTAYSLFVCFIFAAVANILHVNIVFGAFLAGILIGSDSSDTFVSARRTIKDISLSLFVPLYFAIVGLRLDLIHQFRPWMLLAFLLFSTAVQVVGTICGARIVKLNWLSSFNLAVAMNARGGPGIVLASIAFDLGLINEAFFTTLVLTAIITCLFAGAWFNVVVSYGRQLLSERDELRRKSIPFRHGFQKG